MRFLSERWQLAAAAAVATALCALAAGCGRANLTSSTQGARPQAARRAPSPPHATTAPRPYEVEHVPVPLPLSEARAARFARAVALRQVDLPGAVSRSNSGASPAERAEAASCGKRSGGAVGGGRSAIFERGAGLNRESVSSAVQVLRSAAAVQGDIEYVASKSGLDCWAKVLRNSLLGDQPSALHLVVQVRHLRLGVEGHQDARGIRVAARVGVNGRRGTVQLFVDALSLPYGPAELDLYSTSFVQPVPAQTQSELLKLMLERAQLERL